MKDLKSPRNRNKNRNRKTISASTVAVVADVIATVLLGSIWFTAFGSLVFIILCVVGEVING